MSKLIAFDQALNVTGYAIFEEGELVSHGKFVSSEQEVKDKLHEIREFAISLIDDEGADEIAIEEIQLQQIPGTTAHGNVETFKKLAYVQAILLEVISEKDLKYSIVPSASWKSTCGVKGRARAEQKRSAQDYVLSEFGIKPIQDIVDAICIGKHVITNKSKEINWE